MSFEDLQVPGQQTIEICSFQIHNNGFSHITVQRAFFFNHMLTYVKIA